MTKKAVVKVGAKKHRPNKDAEVTAQTFVRLAAKMRKKGSIALDVLAVLFEREARFLRKKR